MTVRTLVFGKDGQLGRAFQERIGSNPNTLFLGRQECDLANFGSIRNFIEQFDPDQIINAAAYTAVDKAENERNAAFAINEGAVSEMARYCHNNNKQFLHFSTDYIFDGEKSSPYVEGDQYNPLNIYGQSKLAGEQAIQEIFSVSDHGDKQSHGGGAFFILRATWVYGDGANFVNTILRLAKERSELKVVSDQFGVPTHADWLSRLSLEMLCSDGIPSGIYHAVPSGKTSWYELARFVVQCAKEMGLTLKLELDRLLPIPTSEYSLPAKRPTNSVLSTGKLGRYLPSAQSLLEEDWQVGVKAYICELRSKGLV
jgi:dTDP-4-dehydrorhamnose reductase